jgi:predicted RNA-binding Zn-ribbon protein involved in translation (DUF1610 family)
MENDLCCPDCGGAVRQTTQKEYLKTWNSWWCPNCGVTLTDDDVGICSWHEAYYDDNEEWTVAF